MNREILFRGKTETDNRWIYGDLIHYGKYLSIRCNMPDKLGIPNYIEFIVNPTTVSQFTGYEDKKGRKIFENDIVKANKHFYSKQTAVVKWLNDRCSFYFIAETVGTDIINREPFQSAYKINSHKVEVIGNVFDNVDFVFF